jgi:hypothetical protein
VIGFIATKSPFLSEHKHGLKSCHHLPLRLPAYLPALHITVWSRTVWACTSPLSERRRVCTACAVSARWAQGPVCRSFWKSARFRRPISDADTVYDSANAYACDSCCVISAPRLDDGLPWHAVLSFSWCASSLAGKEQSIIPSCLFSP